MLKAEYQQEQRVRENEANCEQLKSELEKIQRRQRGFDRQKEKGTRTTERAAAGSRLESRMEVDEAPRSKGRFNLDRAAQEHKRRTGSVDTNRASVLRAWFGSATDTPTNGRSTAGIYPSSTPGSSQMSGSSSRLTELHERLQLRNRESPTRVERPPTWREQPVRNVVIASYKKNTDGRYHRNNRMDWNAAQRTRRDWFHDAAWDE